MKVFEIDTFEIDSFDLNVILDSLTMATQWDGLPRWRKWCDPDVCLDEFETMYCRIMIPYDLSMWGAVLGDVIAADLPLVPFACDDETDALVKRATMRALNSVVTWLNDLQCPSPWPWKAVPIPEDKADIIGTIVDEILVSDGRDAVIFSEKLQKAAIHFVRRFKTLQYKYKAIRAARENLIVNSKKRKRTCAPGAITRVLRLSGTAEADKETKAKNARIHYPRRLVRRHII